MEPKDWDLAKMEGISEVGLVLVTTAVDLLRRYQISMVWLGRLQ